MRLESWPCGENKSPGRDPMTSLSADWALVVQLVELRLRVLRS